MEIIFPLVVGFLILRLCLCLWFFLENINFNRFLRETLELDPIEEMRKSDSQKDYELLIAGKLEEHDELLRWRIVRCPEVICTQTTEEINNIFDPRKGIYIDGMVLRHYAFVKKFPFFREEKRGILFLQHGSNPTDIRKIEDIPEEIAQMAYNLDRIRSRCPRLLLMKVRA